MSQPEDSKVPQSQEEKDFTARDALIAGMFLGVIGFGIAMLITANLDVQWTWQYWGNSDGTFDRSTIFRNFGLFALAAIGLVLAVWRSFLAHKQTNTANRQAEIANKQAKLAESGLQIDRYQKGAQMLESSELSVRIAGIFALRELAISDPDDTYFLVLDILYSFVREKSKERKQKSQPIPNHHNNFPADIQIALNSTNFLRETIPNTAAKYRHYVRAPDLSGAKLSGANLIRANLNGANFRDADLSCAMLANANLSYSDLYGSNIGDANLINANLSHSNLGEANLSGAHLRGANLSEAFLGRTNLSGTYLGNANLTGASLVETNLSGASLVRVNMPKAELVAANLSNADLAEISGSKEAKFTGLWTYEETPPKLPPWEIVDKICFRKRDENWNDFVVRMMRERPELGWTEDLMR